MKAFLRLLPQATRDQTAKRATSALVGRGVDPASITYDAEGFRLEVQGEHFFLGNLHTICRMAWPWQRQAITRQFMSSFGEFSRHPKSFEDARAHLLPGVRDSSMFEAVRLDSAVRGLIAEPTSGHALGSRLWLAAFLDYPNTTSAVTTSDLKTWGVSWEECLRIAVENLVAKSSGDLVEVAEGVYHSPWQDCYDPARMLCPEFLGPLRLSGDPVTVAPNWNHLFVTGSNDLGGLAGCINIATKILGDEPRPMSALPLVRRGTQWVDLVLPRGHAVEPLLRKSRVLELNQVYGDQAALLAKLHEKEGTDTYVAKYNATRRENDDRYDSYVVWSKDVVTLLPHAERVSFFDDTQPEGRKIVADVDWDIMRQHCAQLMKDTDYALPRYFVEAFPTEEQLQAMRAAQALRPVDSRS